MSQTTTAPLTSRQRLTRGLVYTVVGPADVTRAIVELGARSTQTGASALRRRYRDGRLARELAAAQETVAQELAAAQQVVTALPATLQDARRSRGKRPWIIAGVAASVLAGGAVAFSVIRRRSSRPEPSPRPPSVDVQSTP